MRRRPPGPPERSTALNSKTAGGGPASPARREDRPRPEGYPWAREREALEALAALDVERCRAALSRLAEEIQVPAGSAPGVVALLLHELLLRIEAALAPSPPARGGVTPEENASPGAGERMRRAERLGTADGEAALRGAFLMEVEALFAPLASRAALSPGVLRARAYLDRNFTRRITLAALGEAVHLSPNYLSTIFRREMGMTVTRYLRQRRMRLAEQLLLGGKHTISEIAYLVGYRNYRDFHRNFVRSGGASPRTFQRQCRVRRSSLRTDPSPSAPLD